ncbi:hypothetical protein BAUCODRAFT_38184 [Baudoinia panamericana UAMH 10762]|uniref:Conidiation-specific protein 6 n=1 Tax=Baudoinia panamericana (strain UAMH 10762) TaxID=717646 RepID=M2MZR4_BAUPA|nr:uncharacterized protein BAUCODRAFT_38184 [Baudoinia panamericana UAMH 10762]EMC92159.1 hypothetical protein BAUCODRAFT_38184 [Baudoinia panamericana UAMH 10762]
MENTAEDRMHAAQGHKANLSNPNTSEESKKNSRQALEQLGGEDAFYGKKGDDAPAAGMGDDNRVLGGHKATLSNEGTSDAAKQHSKEVLEKNS